VDDKYLMKHSHYTGFLFFNLSLVFFLLTQVLDAQPVSKINCLLPHEMNFEKKASSSEGDNTVLYQDHDDHTFWYKLNFDENQKFSYSISSLDDQDNFDVYFYQYNGNNFCRSFIQNSIDLLSYEKNLEIKAEKGSYYLGIFPLFPGGCGHKIEFTSEEVSQTLYVKNAKKNCISEEVVANPEPIPDADDVVISGKIMDAGTGNTINARLILIDPFTGHEKRTFSKEGKGFEVHLKEDGDYKIKIEAFGYKDKITALSAYDGAEFIYSLESSEKKNYVLNNVYFYPNTYALKDESIEELEGIYSFLKNHPELQIQIVGHTNGDKDVKASRLVREKGEEWNFSGTAKDLSFRRADKIKTYLVDKGIDGITIKAIGKGGEEMVVENPSNMKEAMQNIRVEIIVTSQG
jgi:outer membrane protein OmpA-like peptidoglycan-associated protein